MTAAAVMAKQGEIHNTTHPDKETHRCLTMVRDNNLIHKLILFLCQASKVSKCHFDCSESVLDNRRWIHVVLMQGLDTPVANAVTRLLRIHASNKMKALSSHPRMPLTIEELRAMRSESGF
jgi:hypothetical protein